MEFQPEKHLGFGLMRMPQTDPNDASKVDVEQMCRMVDLFMERGFTYFDTAWMYNGFASESVAKQVLVDRYPRESFTLATKLHSGFFKSEETREEVFATQLEHTGAGYFDYYLLHGIEGNMLNKYESFHCFEWLQEKKKAGLIRHAGFSFHDRPEILEGILKKHPEVEFVQLQINYLDWESEWIQARACYEVARKYDKPVIVMEPAKGGTLSHVPDEAKALFDKLDPSMSISSWAIRFVASLPGVMVVLSGMSNLEQVEDNTSYMSDFVPLTEEEKATCFQVADIINSKIAIPCTGCSYCVEGCPQRIPIPKYFSMYNEDMRENLEEKGWTINLSNYATLSKKAGKAGSCIACGQCESVCPQHLTIIDYLKDVANHYGS